MARRRGVTVRRDLIVPAEHGRVSATIEVWAPAGALVSDVLSQLREATEEAEREVSAEWGEANR